MSAVSKEGTENADQHCAEVPFVEQLRDVPKDYRAVREIQWATDGTPTGHQFIPVGFMFHRAADLIEQQARSISEEQRRAEEALAWTDEDKPLPEDAAIEAAHPLKTHDYRTHAEAMRLVGAKRSKGALVDLVNWLLRRREEVTAKIREIHQVMKRGEATQDHGLDGNLACILDGVLAAKEHQAEHAKAAQFVRDCAKRVSIVNADTLTIEEAADSLALLAKDYREDFEESCRALSLACKRADRFEDYVEGLKADAERYRYLRAHFTQGVRWRLEWYLPRWGEGTSAEQLDATLDAALAKNPNPAGHLSTEDSLGITGEPSGPVGLGPSDAMLSDPLADPVIEIGKGK